MDFFDMRIPAPVLGFGAVSTKGEWGREKKKKRRSEKRKKENAKAENDDESRLAKNVLFCSRFHRRGNNTHRRRNNIVDCLLRLCWSRSAPPTPTSSKSTLLAVLRSEKNEEKESARAEKRKRFFSISRGRGRAQRRATTFFFLFSSSPHFSTPLPALSLPSQSLSLFVPLTKPPSTTHPQSPPLSSLQQASSSAFRSRRAWSPPTRGTRSS